MIFEGFWAGFDPLRILLSLVTLVLFFLLLPKLMIYTSLAKMKRSLLKMQNYAKDSEELFLKAVMARPTKAIKESLIPMKNLVIVPPTDLDPYGIIQKLEHLLDGSETKIKNYIEKIAPKKSKDEKANLAMAFKGVYGAHQLYVIMRHFTKLIEKTNNYQLGAAIQMFLPMYEEVSKSQKDATVAFVKALPIGDSIGPFVAASFISKKPKEVAEDIILSTEKVGGKKLLVLKSNGPGSRLGKYGDAVKKLIKTEKIEEIITVDAGLRFEGEETGTVVEGIGVLMGGPGVEKYKIEQAATEAKVPLEGFIVKMSAPQASEAMSKKVYEGGKKAVKSVEKQIKESEAKTILLIGVGNTVGVGNIKKELGSVPKKLVEYWKENKKESTSYVGLMKAFPLGGG